MGISHYTCSVCGAEFSTQEAQYVCPRDGGNLTIHLGFESAAVKPDPNSIL